MRRPSIDQYMMEFARTAALRGTCPRMRVGAVIATPDGRPLVTGYNGAARGETHCSEAGCDVRDPQDPCSRAIHAEANALYNAARFGVAVDGMRMWCTHSPCKACAKAVKNAGIRAFTYESAYPRFSPESAALILQPLVAFSLLPAGLDALS